MRLPVRLTPNRCWYTPQHPNHQPGSPPLYHYSTDTQPQPYTIISWWKLGLNKINCLRHRTLHVIGYPPLCGIMLTWLELAVTYYNMSKTKTCGKSALMCYLSNHKLLDESHRRLISGISVVKHLGGEYISIDRFTIYFVVVYLIAVAKLFISLQITSFFHNNHRVTSSIIIVPRRCITLRPSLTYKNFVNCKRYPLVCHNRRKKLFFKLSRGEVPYSCHK